MQKRRLQMCMHMVHCVYRPVCVALGFRLSQLKVILLQLIFQLSLLQQLLQAWKHLRKPPSSLCLRYHHLLQNVYSSPLTLKGFQTQSDTTSFHYTHLFPALSSDMTVYLSLFHLYQCLFSHFSTCLPFPLCHVRL